MKKKIGDKARLYHILEAIQEIETYTKECDLNKFETTSIIRDAAIRKLEIIGEAAKHLTNQTKSLSKETPWNQIVGLH